MRVFNFHSACFVFISTNSRHIAHSAHITFFLKHFFLNNGMSDKGKKKLQYLSI